MPELPEVETVRQQLLPHVLNKKITKVEFKPEKIVGNNSDFGSTLESLEFSGIERVGKLLTFGTSDPDLFMIGHLKMTGQLIYVDAKGMAGGGHTLTAQDLNLPHKHTHVVFGFEDGSKLYFNDMRKFGFLRLVDKVAALAEQSKYGIEPISDTFSLEYFTSVISGRKTTIKAALLQQNKIAGLGNIYVDEACWVAKVRPDRLAGSLESSEVKLLHSATRKVLEKAIEAGGTTFYDFTDAKGGEGRYVDQLKVFKKEGQPCSRCKEIIQKVRVAGRGTHFCPGCQK